MNKNYYVYDSRSFCGHKSNIKNVVLQINDAYETKIFLSKKLFPVDEDKYMEYYSLFEKHNENNTNNKEIFKLLVNKIRMDHDILFTIDLSPEEEMYLRLAN